MAGVGVTVGGVTGSDAGGISWADVNDLGAPLPAMRLTKPLGDLKPRYDAVIVGSGYGGAVSASRLARAGLREIGRAHV